MPPHIKRRSNGYQNPHTRESDTGIPTGLELSQQVSTVWINLPGHRARDAQAQENRVIGNGQDERGGDALMLFWHGAAEQDDSRGEAYVHAEGDDEGRDEGLAPVRLANRHCGGEDRGNAESDEGGDHDVWDLDFRY